MLMKLDIKAFDSVCCGTMALLDTLTKLDVRVIL